MMFYAAFNSISVISRRQFTLFVSFLGFTSTRLGSEVTCPRTLPRKNPEDPVRLESRTPGLQVRHFTTKPRGTRERERQRETETETERQRERERERDSNGLLRAVSTVRDDKLICNPEEPCRRSVLLNSVKT